LIPQTKSLKKIHLKKLEKLRKRRNMDAREAMESVVRRWVDFLLEKL